LEELDMIANTTAFNNQKLLSGSFTNKAFQVGAYSGETVQLSSESTQTTKIGHVTTGDLTLSSAGTAEIAIYSNLQNQYFSIQSVDVLYNNSAENGIGALADAINRLSDVLGISASATVESTTAASIAAGTITDFQINGVAMGDVAVKANDSDGALVTAINQKTSQHGVMASVDGAGSYAHLHGSQVYPGRGRHRQRPGSCRSFHPRVCPAQPGGCRVTLDQCCWRRYCGVIDRQS
jgi:flagellin